MPLLHKSDYYILTNRNYLTIQWIVLSTVPSVQWGLADPTTQYPWKYTFPIAFTSTSYAVSLLRITGGGCFSLKLQEKSAYAFTWTDYGTDGNAGSGDQLSVIVVGF